jgi:mRNA deadenylase 3'-5' endonuclease subunit Ccr4
MFSRLENKMQAFPDAKVILAGDFNLPPFEDECIARTFANWECNMADYILCNCELLNLKDTHRKANNKEGTTNTF